MKIIQVSTIGFADPRFYRSNEFVLCKSLARLGHDVTLFSSDRHPKWQIPEERKASKRVEELEGFMIKRFPAGMELGVVPLMPTLLKELFASECDLVHAHTILAPSSFYSALYSRVGGKPFVVTQHDYLYGAVHGTKLFVHMVNNNTFGRLTMKVANVVIGLSSAAAKFAEKFGAAPSRTHVIPSSVDTSLFRPHQGNLLKEKWGIRGKVILFVGKLMRDKAPWAILQAFREVEKRVPDAKLVILGKGPEESRLRALKQRLQLKNVHFIPRIPREDMPQIYPGADLLVLPSLFEPFGNVVLEALASGLPVVGSKIGGMADVIINGQTGFHIAPGSAQELAKYTLLMLEDEGLRKKMGVAARMDAVERLDDLVVTRRVENLYLQSIKR